MPQHPSDASARCIVVDDCPAVLSATVDVLRSTGYVVCGVARTGVGALRLLDRTVPDLVVVEARLPDLDGVDVACLAREAQPDVAIVLWTADATAPLVAAAVEAGVLAVVIKDGTTAPLIVGVAAAVRGTKYLDPRLPSVSGTYR